MVPATVMVPLIPPPASRVLVPPLLACLPMAFASTQPPPALLPLLVPILRQRLQFLTSPRPEATSWLSLLCWDTNEASLLSSVVEEAAATGAFEPHPVSGEIDLPVDAPVSYRRLDSETLQARLPLAPTFELTVICGWCVDESDGGAEWKWKVAELLPRGRPADGLENPPWLATIEQTEQEYKTTVRQKDILVWGATAGSPVNGISMADNDDDDDYWARYDHSAGQTPGMNSNHGQTRQVTDPDSYFDRYANVQPALDADDLSNAPDETGASSVNGDLIASIIQQHAESIRAKSEREKHSGAGMQDAGVTISDRRLEHQLGDSTVLPLRHPRPSSTSSSNSDMVNKLEETAENQSAAAAAVARHISTTVQSLFRLAKHTGISRADFEGIVQQGLYAPALDE